MQELISIKDLVISYNENKSLAVNHISLQVSAGEVLGLLGSNGAGKTSTLRALAGLLPPTSGEIAINGQIVDDSLNADRARSLIGYCPDTGGLIRQATPREHIGLSLGVRNKLSAWPYALELISQFGLDAVLDTETTGFSHGMSRRLSVVLAVISAEKVLILDEPFDGVDPLGVEVTINLIKKAKSEGLAVIVSTHLLSLLVEASDRICVMSAGKIIDDEPSAFFDGQEGSLRYSNLLKAK